LTQDERLYRVDVDMVVAVKAVVTMVEVIVAMAILFVVVVATAVGGYVQ
jgi:hypothetical protein